MHHPAPVTESPRLATLSLWCESTTEVLTARPTPWVRWHAGEIGKAWIFGPFKFQSDVTGIPVDVAAVTETTSLGAAYLAGLTVGIWKDYNDIDRLRKSGRCFEPSWSPAQTRRPLRTLGKAVERSRRWARPT